MQPTDSRTGQSKVKPRVMPTTQGPSSLSDDQDAQAADIPPPTTISTMQAIGIQLCTIPDEELSVAALTQETEGPFTSN